MFSCISRKRQRLTSPALNAKLKNSEIVVAQTIYAVENPFSLLD
jgi:hypothetical protein